MRALKIPRFRTALFQEQNSHEEEFLDAVSLELLWKILDGKDFVDLARRHKFMKQTHSECASGLEDKT